MVLIEVAKPFGYVIMAAVASYFVHHIYMPMSVMAARKKYGVDFPNLYATPENCGDEKARKEFNCVQRAHQNSLENYPSFLALLLTSGVKYPITAASLAAIYLVGRIVYFMGYSTGNPSGRYRGGFMFLGSLGLLGTLIKFAVDLLA